MVHQCLWYLGTKPSVHQWVPLLSNVSYSAMNLILPPSALGLYSLDWLFYHADWLRGASHPPSLPPYLFPVLALAFHSSLSFPHSLTLCYFIVPCLFPFILFPSLHLFPVSLHPSILLPPAFSSSIHLQSSLSSLPAFFLVPHFPSLSHPSLPLLWYFYSVKSSIQIALGFITFRKPHLLCYHV